MQEIAIGISRSLHVLRKMESFNITGDFAQNPSLPRTQRTRPTPARTPHQINISVSHHPKYPYLFIN
jgi:hypothetical protein